MRHRLPLLWVSATVLLLAGCAGQSWDRTRELDTAAAYRRFLADHPNSSHAAEAEERIAVLQLEREPSLQGFEEFQRAHANGAAAAELARELEPRLFEAARAEATPDAYDRFVAVFPNGDLADRARGNAEYLRAAGFAGRPDALALFVRQYAASDYAVEARRTLAAIEGRRAARVGAVGLRIEIASGVGEADRLRNVFSERAHETYAAAGIPLVDGAADTTLTIRHQERNATPGDADGLLSRAGVVAETSVSLQRAGDAEPIWSEAFRWNVQGVDMRPGGSALFASSASGYWDQFFVPVATWPTQLARRPAWSAGADLAAVEVGASAAIALAPDGSFRELDLSDPAAPRVVASYRRSGGLARFSGVQRTGERIVLFGDDGLEVVARAGSGYRRLLALDRGSVGAVSGVAEADGALLIAGTRGLVRVSRDGARVERLVERPLRGIARSGDTLLVIDDQWLYAGSVRDPSPGGLSPVSELGRGLEVLSLRSADGLAVVVGERGIACFEIGAGGSVRALARPRASSIGDVRDAAILDGTVFLLGRRGLQVFDPTRGRVIDAVDVEGRAALAAADGQVVAIGGNRLEVVDASPWTARSAPAAPAR